jgi:hypothetical protein
MGRFIGVAVLFAFSSLAAGCAKPAIVPKGEKPYAVSERGEELFVYVDYLWHGGKFDDAKELERGFAAWGVEQGIFVTAMGRFPAPREWQLGFVATGAPPENQDYLLHEIKSEKLPAGRWATMETRGNVDYLFRYWRKLARWIEKDGLATSGPVVEVYPDLLAKDVAPDAVRGEIRYPLAAQ